jgi:hypothetical protein
MMGRTPFEAIIITAGASAVTAIVAVIITYVLTKKREHEADWRRLKFSQYQEFILALSGIVRGRSTSEGHSRYADAVNSMALVAPLKVLSALKAFQKEISYTNNQRSDERHDQLLNVLLRAMREDIQPNRLSSDASFSFRLLAPPPDSNDVTIRERS